MPAVRVSASAPIGAPAPAVYAVLADYHRGHPRVLPPSFTGLDVEAGGVGAGTVVRVTTRGLGRTQTMRLHVTEPEPGRVLVETDRERGLTTTFTVEPSGPASSVATITTEWEKGGLAGWAERLVLAPLMRRVFADELRRLDAVAREGANA